MHGFLNVDKPAGMTSHDVVAYIRRLSKQKRVGHAGTLDPAATGVLIVGLGKATRLIPYVQDETLKRYSATITLGIQTTTDDAEGEVLSRAPVPELSHHDVEQVLGSFKGTIEQIPPMYAAIHHGGQRLYELARRGEVVERAARTISIEKLDILAWQSPNLSLDVVCGKGTYIRALARDIGQVLGCGAYLNSLRRTAVGVFTIDQAHTLEKLNQDIGACLLAPALAVADWHSISPTDAEIGRLRNGMPIYSALDKSVIRAAVYDSQGVLVALVKIHEDSWQPYRVFND